MTDTSQQRFDELKKALQDQHDDEPVEIARDGSVHPVGKAPGQSVVLRDPAGEYGGSAPACRSGQPGSRPPHRDG